MMTSDGSIKSIPNEKLAKLSNVVKNDVDKLVAKLDNIDTTKFVLKTTYDTDKTQKRKQN